MKQKTKPPELLRQVITGKSFTITHRGEAIADLVPNAGARVKAKAYPCVERGGLIWAYMGPAEHKPDFPDLEWTLIPETHRYATRHIQECNWLQGLEGGFDSSHLSFLHGGSAHSLPIVANPPG